LGKGLTGVQSAQCHGRDVGKKGEKSLGECIISEKILGGPLPENGSGKKETHQKRIGPEGTLE